MNNKELETKTLSHDRDVEAPQFKRALRASLMRMHANQPRVQLGGLLKSFSMKKPATFMLAGALALVLVLGAAALPAGNSSVAEAQEALKRSFVRAKAITPEMRAKIEERMKADLFQTLEEARMAPDLRIMTKEEFEQESPFSISTAPGVHGVGVGSMGTKIEGEAVVDEFFHKRLEIRNDAALATSGGLFSAGIFHAAGGVEPALPVKYLSYTSEKGAKVYLGLDENDTPVMKIMELNLEKDDLIKLPDGKIGFPAESIEINSFEWEEAH